MKLYNFLHSVIFEDNTRPWLSDGYLIMHVYLTGEIPKEYLKSVGARK